MVQSFGGDDGFGQNAAQHEFIQRQLERFFGPDIVVAGPGDNKHADGQRILARADGWTKWWSLGIHPRAGRQRRAILAGDTRLVFKVAAGTEIEYEVPRHDLGCLTLAERAKIAHSVFNSYLDASVPMRTD